METESYRVAEEDRKSEIVWEFGIGMQNAVEL